MSSDGYHSRRTFLRGGCLCGVAGVAGCMRSVGTSTEPTDTPSAAPTPTLTTEQTHTTTEPCRETGDGPSTPTSTPPKVYVMDLEVGNSDDADHRITFSITKNGTTVLEDSFVAEGRGGGREYTRAIFDEAGTYNLTVLVGDESTGHRASEDIEVTDSYWREHNGVIVSVRTPMEIAIKTLHADPTPTLPPCDG